MIARITGALEGTRTPNLLIRSQMLYPLSYERMFSGSQYSAPASCRGGCPQQDSNLRSRLRRPLLSPLSYEGYATKKDYQ